MYLKEEDTSETTYILSPPFQNIHEILTMAAFWGSKELLNFSGESRIWQWMLPFWLLHSNLATICDVTHCVLQHGWPGHTYEPHLAQTGATSLMKVERPMLNTTAVCELCILVLTISVECWLLLFMCNEVARSYSNWWHRWSIFSTF